MPYKVFEGTPRHVGALLSNLYDITVLLDLHATVKTEPVPWKFSDPSRVDALLSAALVMLCACWEAFVEDLAEDAYTFIETEAVSPEKLPIEVRKLIAKSVKASHHDLSPWNLAGEGWKQEVSAHRDAVFRKYLHKLNTPKSAQITALFSDLIGMSRVTETWEIKGYSLEDVVRCIDRMVERRGAIAHRVQPSPVLVAEEVNFYLVTIMSVSSRFSNGVCEHVLRITGREPWLKTRFAPWEPNPHTGAPPTMDLAPLFGFFAEISG